MYIINDSYIFNDNVFICVEIFVDGIPIYFVQLYDISPRYKRETIHECDEPTPLLYEELEDGR